MSTDGVSRKGSPHAFLDQTDGMHFEHFLNGKFEKHFLFGFPGRLHFSEWEFEKSLQVFREQMGIRTNGNLEVDFVTLAPKMGSHLVANVL